METKQALESQERDQQKSSHQNSNELTLVPYVLHEGKWTLSSGFLGMVFGRLVQEGSFEKLFYEGTIKTGDQFVQLMQNPSNIPVFIFDGNECQGFAWLNGGSGNMAFAHFCFMRAAWGKKTLKMGHMLTDYWFSFPGHEGPLFEFIFGLMPGFNVAATGFVKRLGWTYLGSIPRMLKCEYLAGRESAEIYYISRFDYGQENAGPCTDSRG